MIKTYRHLNYEFRCSGARLDSGAFTPTLVVIKNVWPTRPREVAMARGQFTTEEAAIASAHAQGIEWVANYG